jgi:thiosulfate dehydrogenase
MGNIGNAARFIKANMPLGQGGKLFDQETRNVAAYIDSHKRSQDPRFIGLVAETRKRFHDSPLSMYGRKIDGVLLGKNSPPAGPQ